MNKTKQKNKSTDNGKLPENNNLLMSYNEFSISRFLVIGTFVLYLVGIRVKRIYPINIYYCLQIQH